MGDVSAALAEQPVHERGLAVVDMGDHRHVPKPARVDRRARCRGSGCGGGGGEGAGEGGGAWGEVGVEALRGGGRGDAPLSGGVE